MNVSQRSVDVMHSEMENHCRFLMKMGMVRAALCQVYNRISEVYLDTCTGYLTSRGHSGKGEEGTITRLLLRRRNEKVRCYYLIPPTSFH